ncbi:hypothetical protein RJ639_003196 [Escallonia herrerae]|uniref:LOB domain-containing protein n=1 Tax=Escallonia herrerae TaxID=1293975 RepID=A0AA88W476_9ASTE|nr:hypothetical protein RJ639_003196 [Escallonia herrerae]
MVLKKDIQKARLVETKVRCENVPGKIDKWKKKWTFIHNNSIKGVTRIWLGWNHHTFQVKEIFVSTQSEGSSPWAIRPTSQKFCITKNGWKLAMRILQELPVHQRGDAVSSLVYEANARVRDPVYGCVGAISFLQNQVSQLQMQLAVAQAEILCLQMQQEADQPAVAIMPTALSPQMGVDDKSFFLHNNLQAQYLNYASNSSNLVIHDTLKRESLFGHDMVS